VVDLNTLIPLDSPFHLYSTSFIDDRGVIAAFGLLVNGDTHALLLVPCDENHPDIEGCDASLVDGSTTETRVSSMAVTREPKTATSPTMRSLHRRFAPATVSPTPED
jgi:hypothetical protein